MAPWVTRIGARSAASPWRTGSIAGVALLMAKPNGANVCPKKKQSRRGIDQRTVKEMGRARAAPPAGPTELSWTPQQVLWCSHVANLNRSRAKRTGGRSDKTPPKDYRCLRIGCGNFLT